MGIPQESEARAAGITKAKGGGIRGNFYDSNTGEEFWVSGVKQRGSNAHCAEKITIIIDDDAQEEYQALRSTRATTN